MSEVVFGDASGKGSTKFGVPGYDREGPAETGLDGGADGCSVLLQDVRVRVPAVAEQRHHLLLVDAVSDSRRVFEAVESSAEPPAGRLAPFAVVLGQADVTHCGSIVRRDLLGEVGIAVAGAQLVQRHHLELAIEMVTMALLPR